MELWNWSALLNVTWAFQWVAVPKKKDFFENRAPWIRCAINIDQPFSYMFPTVAYIPFSDTRTHPRRNPSVHCTGLLITECKKHRCHPIFQHQKQFAAAPNAGYHPITIPQKKSFQYTPENSLQISRWAILASSIIEEFWGFFFLGISSPQLQPQGGVWYTPFYYRFYANNIRQS